MTSVSLQSLVQECSRAIAACPFADESLAEVASLVAAKTGALGATIHLGEPESVSQVAQQAFSERRLCIVSSGEEMLVAAPVKHGSRVFGVLLACFASTAARSSGAHAASELVSAVASVVGNALELADRAPGGVDTVLTEEAYAEYLRAHFELFRSYRVPFAIAVYNLRHRLRLSRVPAAAALRWAVRSSDAVFAMGEGMCAVLLTNCSGPGASTATRRVKEITGLDVSALIVPRRGESFRHFRVRASALGAALA